jgi:uncharacterized protein (TIGR02271 family)
LTNREPNEEIVLPVVEERLKIDRQTIETGVLRIHKRVREREEIVKEPVIVDEVEVERVPINRFVDEAPPVRYEGDVTIIPLVEEVLVLEKRLKVTEEVRVFRKQRTMESNQPVTLRSEYVNVERAAAEPPSEAE